MPAYATHGRNSSVDPHSFLSPKSLLGHNGPDAFTGFVNYLFQPVFDITHTLSPCFRLNMLVLLGLRPTLSPIISSSGSAFGPLNTCFEISVQRHALVLNMMLAIQNCSSTGNYSSNLSGKNGTAVYPRRWLPLSLLDMPIACPRSHYRIF